MSGWRAGVLLIAVLAALDTAAAASLEVRVQVPEPDQGTVYLAIFDEAQAFPDPEGAHVRQARKVEGAEVQLRISSLEPGDYAVAAFQDLDGDEELTTNWIGVPKEPAGFSRNAMGTMGPPSFAEAAVTLAPSGSEIIIDLTD
ncbi:MAG: DUF2141 domain-containing protein [Halorhodospira sp.]